MKRIWILSLALLLAGCGAEQIETYRVPKANPTPAVQAAGPVTTPSDAPAYTAELPAGWTELPASGMRMASYAIEGTSIDFYLISLSMGDTVSNVNRWRQQVHLLPAAPAAVMAEIENLQAGELDIRYIEIYNEEEGLGIIAAIVDRSPGFWFFTAKGTVEELKAHAPDIRRFLESLKVNP